MSNESELIFEGESSTQKAFQLTKEWFEERKAALQAVVDRPKKQSIVFQYGDGESVEIKDRDAFIFRAGISTALDMFGEFPLKLTTKNPDATN